MEPSSNKEEKEKEEKGESSKTKEEDQIKMEVQEAIEEFVIESGNHKRK